MTAQLGNPLTPRETEVLAAVAAGDPYKAVAERLGIEETTVRTHMSGARRKIGAANDLTAVLRWLFSEPRLDEVAAALHDEHGVPSLQAWRRVVRLVVHEVLADTFVDEEGVMRK